jgi:pyruvate/2-oxoglutarate dehydrogenase complex dihydrolipoamide dehydrogenase (E3) component
LLPDDAHNRQLVERTHPPGWVNPAPAGRYNLVVIGAGTAGLVTAAGAAGLGARVALVEKHLLGGDCLNYGCVPSKALLAAARAAAAVRDAGRFGVRVPAGVTVDFPAVMERMRRLRAELSVHDSAERFRSLGVDVFLGPARFTGRDAVEVGGETLCFRKAVIATGARAAEPDVPGLKEAGYLTNETVFSLTERPRRLAVIGAGPIGCELAQGFARLGSAVTLIANHDRVLPREDPAASALVQRAMGDDGVHLLLEAAVTRTERQGGEHVLHVQTGGGAHEVRADAVLVGVGRAPNVEGLGLEAAGVEYDAVAGVRVDDRLRTSNRAVFAAGDVCSRFKFTHAADAMARVVVRNALFLGRTRASALTIPWCTYTDPEVAHVGLYPEEAEAKGVAINTFVVPLDRVDRAVLEGDDGGFVKVHVRRGTGRIVGATVVARHAGEMIAEVALAMTAKLGMAALSETIHPYPTEAEALRKAGDAWNRTRLTPLVKWLFDRWLAWRR